MNEIVIVKHVPGAKRALRGALVRRGQQSAANLTKASRGEARHRRRVLLNEPVIESVKSAQRDDRPITHLSSQSWVEVRTVTYTERKSASLGYRAKLTASDRRWDSDKGVGFTPYGANPKNPVPRVRPEDQERVAAKVAAIKRNKRNSELWPSNDSRWS